MKNLTKIILFVTAPILPLTFIFYKADLPNREDNGFTRSFLPESPVAVRHIDLENRARGIVGERNGEILFSTHGADGLIAVSASDGRYRSMPATSFGNGLTIMGHIKNFSLQMQGQHLYLFDYHLPTRYAIDMDSKRLESTIPIGFFCSTIASPHPNTVIVRGYANPRSSLLFGRVTTAGDTLWEKNISLPSLDGGLSTDGQLLHEHGSGLLSYMHYYNNNVIVFDTLLNISNTFTTLDTVAPKLRLDPTKPRLITNKTACIHRGTLYICSNLRADNETYWAYMKNIPVDTYNIRTGAYLGSFYLPVDDGKLIQDLRIMDGVLYAFYFSGRLSVFSLPGDSS